MTCAKISELLTDYVMGELPQDLNKIVDEHLQGCSVCRSEHFALKKITSELQEMAHHIEPPEYLSNQLEQALLYEVDNPVENKRWWHPNLVVQIAATFLVMVVGWGIWDNQMDGNKELVNDKSSAAVVLEQGERPDKDTETVQDVQLLRKQTNTQSMTVEVEPKTEIKTEPVTPKVTTESTASPEIQRVEILRTNVIDGEDQEQQQSFTIAQTEPIVLDFVQQVKIKLINENAEQIITREDNLEVIAMIVEGINNALPSEKSLFNEKNVTHIITIQLDNGDNYQLNYCLSENIGVVKGDLDDQYVYPGESLSLALQSL